MADLDLKVCPFCAELIKSAAIVCRFCGRDLPPAGARAAPPPTAPGDDGASIDPAPGTGADPATPEVQPSMAPPAKPGARGKASSAKGMESWKAILVGVIVAVAVFVYLATRGR